jgi:lipid A ethanolaminephosphotransferase
MLSSLSFFSGFLFLLIGLISLVMLLLVFGRPARIVLGLALVVAAATSYFTARYGTLFDNGMLTNILETNREEALELVTIPFLLFIAFAGLIPALAIWAYPLEPRRFLVAIVHRSAALLFALALVITPLMMSQKEIVSVARENHQIRHMIAPLNMVSATYNAIEDLLRPPPEFHSVAVDATHMTAASQGRKPLVHVLIVGETARASSFRLDGYALNTNPELGLRNDVQFLEMRTCGTATAVSLPCMFSIQKHNGFDRVASRREDNLLDVAKRSGFDVIWIDNGNGCKGICSRVTNRDVHASSADTICPNNICYDEILVEELRRILDSVTGDTLIVLHELGSHGPAYFRRYPDSFRLFQPDCRSANFTDCSQQQIVNAYDNTIAYTDHVIASAIDTLSAHADQFDLSLIFVSDHGESLGEHGLYLHGMPYKLAPAEQTTVPMIVWLGQNPSPGDLPNTGCVIEKSRASLSHDNLFHIELGMLGISTSIYKPELDILSACHSDSGIRANPLPRQSAARLPTENGSYPAKTPPQSVHRRYARQTGCSSPREFVPVQYHRHRHPSPGAATCRSHRWT